MFEKHLIGYWPLHGDCRDHSGNGHHGQNHGVDLDHSLFNGQDSNISVPPSPTLDLHADFTITAWIRTQQEVQGVVGDILSRFDPARRKGFSLCVKSTAGGYSSQGDDKHLYFGIDDNRVGEWQYCDRPNPHSNYVSNSLTAYNGALYAASLDAANEADWCHVFRYQGGIEWADCGRVGNLRTHGVGPMIAHRGGLYAATWNYDWTRVDSEPVDLCRVYRYAGGQEWQDCGRLGDSIEVNALAVHNGKLYAGSIPRAEVYRYEGGQAWTRMARFYSPDGWVPAEVTGPAPDGYKEWTRVTSLTSFAGKLFAGIGSCTGSMLRWMCAARCTRWRPATACRTTATLGPMPGT